MPTAKKTMLQANVEIHTVYTQQATTHDEMRIRFQKAAHAKSIWPRDIERSTLLTETCIFFSFTQDGTVVTNPKLNSTVPSTAACDAVGPLFIAGMLQPDEKPMANSNNTCRVHLRAYYRLSHRTTTTTAMKTIAMADSCGTPPRYSPVLLDKLAEDEPEPPAPERSGESNEAAIQTAQHPSVNTKAMT